MIRFKDDNDGTYISRTYILRATHEIYNGVRSERHDQHAQLITTIFKQAGMPDFMNCLSDPTIAKCELPKACVIRVDGVVLPILKLRWNEDSFEGDVITVGDEYILGFSFENPKKEELLPPDSIHELNLLKTTHDRLLRLGILDVIQIPRNKTELKKLGFTPAQIRDLQKNLGF